MLHVLIKIDCTVFAVDSNLHQHELLGTIVQLLGGFHIQHHRVKLALRFIQAQL